ncbi:MAG: divergent PAP2 family protein [Thermacetogeniaceae bacterium]|nr:divergent PAP2 family protein [Syntrophomonadaceae bacterium]
MSVIMGLARSRLFCLAAVTGILLWGGLRFLPLLSSDRFILSSLLSVLCTQGMKPFTIKGNGISWRKLFQCGGMPSSHSAVAAALTTALGLEYGWNSSLFQISAVLGGIVIYDSFTLRRMVGEHSRILGEMLREKSKHLPLLGEKMGHTPLEATCGVLCGVICALLVVYI